LLTQNIEYARWCLGPKGPPWWGYVWWQLICLDRLFGYWITGQLFEAWATDTGNDRHWTVEPCQQIILNNLDFWLRNCTNTK
jgi:hypothetical protein